MKRETTLFKKQALPKGQSGLVDSPAENDLLDFMQFAQPIANRIISTIKDKSTPMTIGVYGEWGSGKSTFLKLVDHVLREKKIYPIWFNAWKYNQEDNLWAALIQKILDQAPVDGPWYQRVWIKLKIWWNSLDLRNGLWDIFKKLAVVLIRLLLVLVSVLIVLVWSPQDIAAFLNQAASQFFQKNSLAFTVAQLYLIKAFIAVIGIVAAKPDDLWKLFGFKLGLDFSKMRRRQTYQERIAFIDHFDKEFERIAQTISKEKPLVIIIDDLDRCLPEKALQVLEAIKLFLDVKHCVFLLAVDREIVESAISLKYKDIFALGQETSSQPRSLATFLGENYFDKIINLSIPVPPISSEQAKIFVSSLYDAHDVRQCASIFATGLPRNPRKIKRALQAFLLLRDMAMKTIELGTIKPSLLAKLVVIQSQFRALYNEIVDYPLLLEELEKYYRTQDAFAPEKLEAVSKMTSENQLLHEITQKKVEMYAKQYPQLRDLLLLSVDRGDTFIGVNMGSYVFLLRSVIKANLDTFAVPSSTLAGDAIAILNQGISSHSIEGDPLIAAQQVLAALSLDTIPPIAQLPPNSLIRLRANPLFVSRNEELCVLAAALKTGEAVAITGLGGVGKTELANEFVHRYGQFFSGGVFWLSFEDSNAVPAGIAACGGPGALDLHPDFSKLSLEDQLQLVRSAWQSPLPRLLVFDNCEDEELFKKWCPSSGACRVLITSRRAVWNPELGVTTLQLNVLKRQESIVLLRKFRNDLPADDPNLNSLAAKLGDLPLAIHLAGSYLRQYRYELSPTDYLKRLEEQSSIVAINSPSLMNKEETIRKSIAWSYNLLDPTSPIDHLALTLLTRAAYFPEDQPIAREKLRATLDVKDNAPEADIRFADALSILTQMSLLQPTDSGRLLHIHRLIAAFVREEVDANAQKEAQSAVERVLKEHSGK